MVLTHTPTTGLGVRAPEFSLPGTDGRTHTLQSCRGPMGLLVAFICNHCPYVQAIRERLVSDARELQSVGIGVVAISANDPTEYPEDSFESMKVVAKEYAFPFPYLYDQSQAVARAYGAVCTPDFFGYNAMQELQYRGRLDAAHRGPRDATMKRELVDAMFEIARTGRTRMTQVPSMGCNIKYRA